MRQRRLVAAGKDAVITRRGERVARLVAVREGRRRPFGLDRGRLVVAEGFDAPLDVDVLEAFEPGA